MAERVIGTKRKEEMELRARYDELVVEMARQEKRLKQRMGRCVCVCVCVCQENCLKQRMGRCAAAPSPSFPFGPILCTAAACGCLFVYI